MKSTVIDTVKLVEEGYCSLPRESGIYMICIGDRFYYGQAQNLRDRARQHKGFLLNGKHTNMRMQRAFNKEKEALFSIVEIAPKEKLNDLEQALLDAHKNDIRCLNVATDARASARGRLVSLESRKKMRSAYFARSEESRKKMEIGRKGRKWSRSQHEAFAKAREKFVTPEYRRKLSAATRARYQDPEYISRMMKCIPRGGCHGNARSIYLVMPSGEQLEFGSKVEAAQYLNVKLAAFDSWVRGVKPWPGRGSRVAKRMEHLRGISGGYL